MAPTNLSVEEKARILAWKYENVSTKEIAKRTGRGESTIRRLVASARGLPLNVVPPRKSASGRPRKTSSVTDTLLRREVLKNPNTTAGELKKIHPQLLHNVSERTIQHRLQKELGLPTFRPAHKPLLTRAMVKKRLSFARKYRHWTVTQWRKVLFSDESTFLCFRSRSGGRIRRPHKSNRFALQYTAKTVKHSDKVMVWGGFSGVGGRGGLYFLPKNSTMNADRYIGVLNDHMLSFFDIHGCSTFMHDSAPCHKAKKVTNWLSDRDIQVLDWPGNSADLNPIENCWNYMKDRLASVDTSSVPRLIHEIKKLWCFDMETDYFEKLADSMPKRLEMVIKMKGQMTKY